MKPRVLQILPMLEMGGVEIGTLEIAKGLVNKGYGSFVASNGGRLVQNLEKDGSKHYKLDIDKKSLLTLKQIPSLKKIIIKNNINILHVRSRLPAWVSYFTWLNLDVKTRPFLISTVHGQYSVNFYSKIMMKGQKIIAISDFIKEYILQNYKDINPESITTIQRGVDPQIFNPNYIIPTSWQCPWITRKKDKYIITLPGRISKRKGHIDFIKIIKLLIERNRAVHGVIAGAHDPKKQKLYDNLKNTINTYNLNEHISMIGQREDMPQIMKASDIVVSLSNIPEAFGRTALEALSLGTPVVAYDHGGASEVLNALLKQGLVPPNDIKIAADKICEFMDNQVLIKHNRQFILKEMIDKTIKVYESSLT